MIPLKLELKNFLSYGAPEQVIDFSPYNLICLSGKNGHGKSALLDALTWALWGQARKTAGTTKADEGLLRLGQTRMLVSVTLQCTGNIYRVRREFAQTYGKPITNLDCQIFNETNNSFVSLTEKTIRQTQEKITKLIGLDYETFINSVFLRQGQSNEFSKKTPKERKHILGTILGLNHYESFQQAANEQVRALLDDKKMLTLELQKLQEIISQETIIIQKQEETQGLCTLNTQALTQALDKRTHLQKEIFILHEHYKNKQQTESLALQEKLLNLKEAKAQRHTALTQHLEQTLAHHTIEQEKIRISREHTIQTRLQKKERLKKAREYRGELEQELEKITILLQEYTQRAQEREQHARQFEKRKNYYSLLIQRGNWTNTQLQEIQQKKSMIHDFDNPACPLCEQMLTAKRKQFLHSKITQQEAWLQARFSRLGTLIKHLKEILVLQHEQQKELSREQEIITQKSTKKKELEQSLARIEQEQVALTSESSTLEQTINTYSHALAYHQQECARIQEQKQNILTHDTILAQLEEQIKAHEQELVALKNNTPLPNQQQEMLEQQERQLTQECENLTKQKEILLQALARFTHEKKYIDDTKELYTQKNNTLTHINTELDDYTILSQTFSKNGLPALLIDESLPELEQEANRILSHLTDNQTQIFIESLRDLKSGGLKETLDIHLSDGMGIRPYELYSGGETFRVDFALRIALSKLLARRAGTTLQTLIIDEGFGSQDEEGLNRILDALHAIQNDFSKIIVVSHLQEFKDSFLVHFTVEKTPTGSVVRVHDRG